MQVLRTDAIYTFVVDRRCQMPYIVGGIFGVPIQLVARAAGPHVFEVGDKAGYIEHAAGEWYEYHYGGGGGRGGPPARPPPKVPEGVLDADVSGGGARRGYGGVLTRPRQGPALAGGPAAAERPRGAQ